MLLMSKSDLLLSPAIDLASFGPLLPQQELLVDAVARLKYSSRVSGPIRGRRCGSLAEPNTHSQVGV